jgi:hypothetical protein
MVVVSCCKLKKRKTSKKDVMKKLARRINFIAKGNTKSRSSRSRPTSRADSVLTDSKAKRLPLSLLKGTGPRIPSFQLEPIAVVRAAFPLRGSPVTKPRGSGIRVTSSPILSLPSRIIRSVIDRMERLNTAVPL